MIYIVIPTFNEKKFIKELIEQLNDQTISDFKIIISDNRSSDGTDNMIVKKYPYVDLVLNDESYWWTKSTNAGIQHALKNATENDFILTINCDTIVKKDYLNNLLICNKKNPNNLIGSVTVDLDSKLIKFGGVIVNKWTAKYQRINHNENYDNVCKNTHNMTIKSSTLPGRGILIPIPIIKKIGLFDEMLPQYFADYEFGFRAGKNSIQPIVCYDAPVYTHMKNTGLNNELRKLSFSQFIYSFFTRRSPHFLLKRAVYIYKSFGIKFFLIHLPLDFLRLIVGSSLRQFKNQH
tara:strand:+ start:165 stop:1040 length:876 start_codon:yes stop_codon:yes gene_type:complete